MKTAEAPAKKSPERRSKARLGGVSSKAHLGGVSKTVFMDDVRVHVPGWVGDINSFRRWTDTNDFPDRGYIWWLAGDLWVDISKEQIFSHVAVKGAIFAALFHLIQEKKLGLMFTDGVLLSNFAVDISGNPDGLFLSRETLKSDRVRLIEGARGGYTELQGSPDMALEVVSDSSEQKDLVTLQHAYWVAGVTEYWLVDARPDRLRFEIFRHTPKGYKASPKRHGWIASEVFGKAFRLTVAKGDTGYPNYKLDVR